MKKILFAVIIIIMIINSCDTNKSNLNKFFIGNEWFINNELFLRNDSSISYRYYCFNQEKLVGDTTFPAIINDSVIIYSQIREKGIYVNGVSLTVTGDTIITDTAYYDFLYINKKPCMIIYSQGYPKILTSKKNIKPPVTQNFEREKFVILGYSIGDTINPNFLRTRNIYNYGNYSIEDCDLKENRDVIIKIIGNNQIYAIERHNIQDYRVEDVMKVITNKLGCEPHYYSMQRKKDDSNFEYEFYVWKAKGVQIKLERRRYVGKELFMNLLEKYNWSLFYDDDVQQAILVHQYKSGVPRSTIIN